MPKLAWVVDAEDQPLVSIFLVNVLVALPRPLRARNESRASATTLLAGSCSACRGLAVKDFGCSQGGAELCQRHAHYAVDTLEEKGLWLGVSDLQSDR